MIEIIPAIDLIDGKCVRLSQGDFDRATIYSSDPLDVAQKFEAAGFRRLHMVDLDGARRGRPANLAVLTVVARRTTLAIDFGGGITAADWLDAVFDAGATMANIGSAAVKSPDEFLLWIERHGGDKFLLGADVRGTKLAVDGWQTATDTEIIPFLSAYFDRGIRQAFATDIRRDGRLGGPAVELYKQIIAALPELKLIASGGVASIADIAALEAAGCAGVIVGKAIYERRLDLESLARFMT